MVEEPILDRTEALGVLGALADIIVLLHRVVELLEERDEEEDDEG